MSDYRLADDADLVAAIIEGRDAALGVLYDRYHRQCFSFSLRILGAEQDAEEAVQETFVRVWRSARQYDPSKSAVGVWVLSIARNLCLDELRRRRRRVPQVPRLDDALEHHGADRTDEQAEQAILRDQVRAALHSLPGDQRSAIELVYYNGLTSNDVGRMLGVPAPTVRSRLRLGLLKLAGVLREGGVIGVD